MLNSIRTVIKEQLEYRELIMRMAIFDIKGNYQVHYLGTVWQFLNPLIQVTIYWLVFGVGIRQGQPVDGIPFVMWLLMGLIPWFFISPAIIRGSNSVFQRVNLVSKMNFPVSLLPTIQIIGSSFQFLILMATLIVVLTVIGIYPSIYYLQLIYYLICLLVFLFAFTLLSSTLSTLVRDYQMLLQSLMRMLLYLTPILWDTSMAPEFLQNILKLNPFYYIIQGFRDSFLGKQWFFEEPILTVYFWVLTMIILYYGSKVHLKFRKNFVDYL